MPLFEFRCRSGHQFETLVRNGEKPKCPECSDTQLEKLLSAPARPASGDSLPIMSSCPPPQAGPCGTGCCRLPMG